tara:strand:- start:619 stop:912 length:294 start_codon:yes stop_codon:yes gene_type:complete
MIFKIHKTSEGRKVVAICDNNLIGKTFKEGKLKLDLDSDFYKGKDMGEERLKREISDANILNIVGEKSIKFVRELKIVNLDNVIKIKGIPHVQLILS